MGVKLFALFAFLLNVRATVLKADEVDFATLHVQEAVQADPCDEEKLKAYLPSVKPSEDVVYQGLINGCKAIGGAFKEVDGTKLVHVSQRVWDYWSKQYYPNAKHAPRSINELELHRVSYGLAMTFALTGSLCKKNEDGACVLLDQMKPIAEKQANELSSLTLASRPSEEEVKWSGLCGGDPECFKYQHKKMTQKITNPKGDWAGHDAYDYHLIQLVDGSAVFASRSSHDLIAIQQKSLQNSLHPALHPGDHIGGLMVSAHALLCTKFLSEGMVKNRAGFDVHVYRYTAIPCPKK